MSEHATGQSNWTEEQKQLYRDRRNKGVRGQISAITVHQSVLTADAGPQRIPLGTKVGSFLSRGKSSGNRGYIRQQRKANSRGE